MTINIRGVIVPSNYDEEWARGYIDKGMFTPESVIRSQITSAPKNEPLNIYINSPGGSVFAGNEIINAVNTWAVATGQAVNITVGALAASMAAAILVQTPAKITAHRNAKIMFHGAWGVQIGGAESMGDMSALLEKMNADFKRGLLAKTTLTAEEIDKWFAEGREGWIDAKRALEIGLINSIVETDDKAIKLSKAAANALTDRGAQIAALDIIDESDDGKTVAPVVPAAPVTPAMVAVAEPVAVATAVPVAVAAPAPAAPVVPAATPAPVDGKKNLDAVSGSVNPAPHGTTDKGNAVIFATDDKTANGGVKPAVVAAPVAVAAPQVPAPDAQTAALAAQTELARKWQGRFDKASAENETLRAELEKAKKEFETEKTEMLVHIGELTGKLNTFALKAATLPDGGTDTVSSWREALAACNGNYETARRRFNDIWRATVKR